MTSETFEGLDNYRKEQKMTAEETLKEKSEPLEEIRQRMDVFDDTEMVTLFNALVAVKQAREKNITDGQSRAGERDEA